jgi:hypothetical protein
MVKFSSGLKIEQSYDKWKPSSVDIASKRDIIKINVPSLQVNHLNNITTNPYVITNNPHVITTNPYVITNNPHVITTNPHVITNVTMNVDN